MTPKPTCKGTRMDGQPCRSTILTDGFCEAHGIGGREKMKLRAHMGGMKAHHGKGLDRSVLGDLETVRDAQRWLRAIAEGVVTGRLKAQEGTAGVRALEAWLKAEQDRVAEDDLAELKDQLAEVRESLKQDRRMEVVK